MPSRRQSTRVRKASRRAQEQGAAASASSSSGTLVGFIPSTQEIPDSQPSSSPSHEEAIQQLVVSIDAENRMRELREKLRVLREQHESPFDASASNITSQTSAFASANNAPAQILIAAENDPSFASSNVLPRRYQETIQ